MTTLYRQSSLDGESEKKVVGEDEVKEQEAVHPLFEQAVEVEDTAPDKAVKLYLQLLDEEDKDNTWAKTKEEAIYALGKLYAKQGSTDKLKQLLVDIRPFFDVIPKAKTAKIVRTLIANVGECSNDVQLQAEICQNAVDWCIQEKRSFLKLRMQSRLASLLLAQQKYKEAIALIKGLLREVKKVDDKLLLVEINLVDARVFLALRNLPKSKGALTAARSAANSIYCPPALQAEIDQMSAVLCAEEKDYKTAFSYFYEAFEGFNTINNPARATQCLKYMLLGKIMTEQPGEVYAIVNGKAGVKFAGVEIASMKAVADAYKERSIHAFDAAYEKYKAQLADDSIVASHLEELKGKLLEQNLLRLIEPFSRVEIAHVAKLIDLPADRVEAQLSEMILDGKLKGTLDQGSGDLLVFDDAEEDKTYAAAVSTIEELGHVVDKLYHKARRLK